MLSEILLHANLLSPVSLALSLQGAGEGSGIYGSLRGHTVVWDGSEDSSTNHFVPPETAWREGPICQPTGVPPDPILGPLVPV